jgi:hypothetical protein
MNDNQVAHLLASFFAVLNKAVGIFLCQLTLSKDLDLTYNESYMIFQISSSFFLFVLSAN